MPLDLQRFNRRETYFLIADFMFGKDEVGWEVWLHLLLFGFSISRQWPSVTYTRRTNRTWFGFWPSLPVTPGGPIYRWNWEKEIVMATLQGRETDQQAVADPNQISPKFFNQVAQIAHFFAMFSFTFVVTAFTGVRWGLGAFAVCILYAIIHEFIWDPLEENAATRGSDLEDFGFLIAGGGFGAILGILLMWLHR